MNAVIILVLLVSTIALINLSQIFWAMITGLALVVVLVAEVLGNVGREAKSLTKGLKEDLKREAEEARETTGTYPGTDLGKDIGEAASKTLAEVGWADHNWRYTGKNWMTKIGNSAKIFFDLIGKIFKKP